MDRYRKEDKELSKLALTTIKEATVEGRGTNATASNVDKMSKLSSMVSKFESLAKDTVPIPSTSIPKANTISVLQGQASQKAESRKSEPVRSSFTSDDRQMVGSHDSKPIEVHEEEYVKDGFVYSDEKGEYANKKAEETEESTEELRLVTDNHPDHPDTSEEEQERHDAFDGEREHDHVGRDGDGDGDVATMLARIEEMNRMLLSDSKVVDLSKPASERTAATRRYSMVDTQAPPTAEEIKLMIRRSTTFGIMENTDNPMSSPTIYDEIDLTESGDDSNEAEDPCTEPASTFGYFWGRKRTVSQPMAPTQPPPVLPTPALTSPARFDDTIGTASMTPRRSSTVMALTSIGNMFQKSSVVEPLSPEGKVTPNISLDDLERLVSQWEARALAAEARVYALEEEVAMGKIKLKESEERTKILDTKLNTVSEVVSIK